jgi:hypothetical protein
MRTDNGNLNSRFAEMEKILVGTRLKNDDIKRLDALAKKFGYSRSSFSEFLLVKCLDLTDSKGYFHLLNAIITDGGWE